MGTENQNKTCLTCKNFVSCSNKKKRYNFVCNKYKSKLISSVSLDSFSEKTQSIDKFKFNPDKQEDFDIFSLIDSFTDEDVLPRDIKIDDSDIPQAPNFFEFATDPRFLNVTPFPKQVEIASNYFNEICWKCSNKDWKKGFPTDCTMEDIRDNIQFFDKGVCPKCGRRKSVQIRKEKMKPYVQLVGLCGQRCVIGSTELQVTEQKVITFEELFNLHDKIEGFQTYKGPDILIYTGSNFEYVTPSNFYYSKSQDVYEVKVSKRFTLFNDELIPYEKSITGTLEHPLLCMTKNKTTEWIKIKDLLKYSSDILGIISVDFDLDAIKYTKIISVCPIEDILYKGKQDVYDITVPIHHTFIANGLINHNSGKSASFDMMEAYRLHWCLKTPKLAQFYGLLPSSQLHTSYVALTFGQAKETIYDTLYDYMTTSPWWQSYREMLDYYGNKYGEELYNIKDTFFRFRTQNITGYPAGPDRRKLRGRTRISGAIDEIGWFLAAQSGTIKYDVDEIHKAMLNSFKTIHAATRKLYAQGYDNVLNPILANISSPSSVNDKIMRLYKQAENSHYMYRFRYSSWEFNPTLSEDDFIDEKINQPKEFMRDYMTIPPMSSNPFIEDIEQLGPCLGTNENAFKLVSDKVTTKSGRIMTSARMLVNWSSKCNRILAIDAGRNDNSFALCLAHNEEVETNGVKSYQPVFDCLTEVIPEKHCPINFTSIFKNVIKSIVEQYDVKMVVADRWNSAKLLDDIETDCGVEVENYSVKYADFSTFKEMIFNNQLTFPRCEGSYKNVSPNVENYPYNFVGKPIQHFLLQCITVQDFGDKTVEKGDGYTDDIFRATVLANSYLVDKDYKMKFVGTTEKRQGGGAIGSRGDMGNSLSSNVGSRPTGYSSNTSFISRG